MAADSTSSFSLVSDWRRRGRLHDRMPSSYLTTTAMPVTGSYAGVIPLSGLFQTVPAGTHTVQFRMGPFSPNTLPVTETCDGASLLLLEGS